MKRTSGALLLVLLIIVVVTGCATDEARAARRGDIEGLRDYVAAGGDVNAPQRRGRSLLIVAVNAEEYESSLFLLDNGARVDSRDDQGRTALIYSATAGNGPITELLLSRGAAVDAQNNDGFSSLMYASRGSHVRVVEILIASGADPNLRENGGSTALFMAVERNQARLVDILLQAGADLQLADGTGRLPIFMAVTRNESVSVLDLLLSYGADPNAQDSRGFTPLMIGAGQHADLIVARLLEAGARPDITASDGSTALLLAIERDAAGSSGFSAATDLLLSVDAPIDIRSARVSAAAFSAATNGNVVVLSLLFDYGINPAMQSSKGENLLTASTAHPEVLRTVLEGGVQVDTPNARRETALIVSSRNGHMESVTILLGYGANVNIAGADGRTPLMYAVGANNLELVRRIVLSEATIWARDEARNTALHLAAATASPEIVRLLLTAGSDVNTTNRNGEQPVDLAGQNAQSDAIIEILVGAGAERPTPASPEPQQPAPQQPAPEQPATPEPAQDDRAVETAPDQTPPGQSQTPPGRAGSTAEDGDQTPMVYPPNQRSRAGNRNVEVAFTNTTGAPIQLLQIDRDGRAEEVMMLAAGRTFAHDTTNGTFFIVRNSEGQDIDSYRATGGRRQEMDIE